VRWGFCAGASPPASASWPAPEHTRRPPAQPSGHGRSTMRDGRSPPLPPRPTRRAKTDAQHPLREGRCASRHWSSGDHAVVAIPAAAGSPDRNTREPSGEDDLRAVRSVVRGRLTRPPGLPRPGTRNPGVRASASRSGSRESPSEVRRAPAHLPPCTQHVDEGLQRFGIGEGEVSPAMITPSLASPGRQQRDLQVSRWSPQPNRSTENASDRWPARPTKGRPLAHQPSSGGTLAGGDLVTWTSR
jgi:hypothetical protein